MKVKTVQIDADVEEVLRAAKLEGNTLTLQSQLDRAMYVKVNKLLDLIGFKWNRKAQSHIGRGDSADKLREGLSDGKVIDEKKTYQFFETPDGLADQMASLAQISPGHRVLEPSAGRGAIIRAIQRQCPALKVIFACELSSYMASNLADLDIEQFLQPKDDKSKYCQVIVSCGDFLQVNEKYDRIVMNPPFMAGQDCDHVKHAYDLLLPGGNLVAIMSPSWLSNESKKFKDFRKWYKSLKDNGYASTPVDLPEGTFKDSGTNVCTVMVVLSKPMSPSHPLNACT